MYLAILVQSVLFILEKSTDSSFKYVFQTDGVAIPQRDCSVVSMIADDTACVNSLGHFPPIGLFSIAGQVTKKPCSWFLGFRFCYFWA